MKAKDKRQIIIGLTLLSIFIAGWGMYNKETNILIIGLFIAGLLTAFEENIIKWFK